MSACDATMAGGVGGGWDFAKDGMHGAPGHNGARRALKDWRRS